jgi:HD domain
MERDMALARMKSVAGIKIPDTPLCCAAVDLLESSSPKWLCTHCLRTFIFGSLAVRGLGRSVADEEAAFCAALLHDLGLVPLYRRDNRFEVDGAEAARDFCVKHRVSSERSDLVWKAIAFHTSPGIPTRLADEVALVHLGAGIDFLGLGLDQVPPQLIEEMLETYPRMNFKTEFRNLLVQHCRHNPGVQVLTWTADVARDAGCTLHGQPIPTASQVMSAAPFSE